MKPVILSPEDLSGLIGLIYESAFEDPQWGRFMTRITELYPGTGALLFVNEGERMFPTYFQSANVPTRLSEDGFEVDFLNAGNAKPLTSLMAVPKGYIARSKKYTNRESYFPSRFFKELMAPHGYQDFLSLVLDSHGNRAASITFTISADPEIEAATHDPLFKTLKLLAPHLTRALHMARALNMARTALSVMGGFLDTIVLPLIVVTAKSEFVFANAAGRRLLAREDLLCVTGQGRVEMRERHEAEALSAKLREMEDTPVASGMRLDREEGSLSLCLTPFRPAMAEANPMDRDLLQEERLFALFVGQRDGDAINSTLLRDVYELTSREAEVCSAVVSGQSAAEIADASARALKTVRNQIQAVHDKVGVSSNVELAEALSLFRTVGAVFGSEAAAPGLERG